MSNWSIVSISFSGLEPFVDPIEVQRAIEAVIDDPLTWIVIPSCGEDSAPGLAVEWWMTTHLNHFDPDDILEPLSGLRWTHPEEVCIVWKNEQMELPMIADLTDWRECNTDV